MPTKLVKTFSGSNLLVDSPSTSPIIERPPLAPMDNYTWMSDELASLPIMPDLSFPSFLDDSYLFPLQDDPCEISSDRLLDEIHASAQLVLDLLSAPGFQYDMPDEFCQPACINPAVLHDSSSTPKNSELPPQVHDEDVEVIQDVNLNFDLPQAQDNQDMRDLLKGETAGSSSSRLKRRHQDEDEDEDEYSDEAKAAASTSEAESERIPRRPRKAARRDVVYNSPSASTSGDDDQEKPFPCKVCGRRFRRDAERGRHEMGHLPTAQQALTCTVALCIKIQDRYTDEELKAMKCVTRVEREEWKKRQAANKNRTA